MSRIRILLADDHSVVRSGLRALFKTSREFIVVGEAINGEEAVRMATKLNPDIAILDISMPKLGGIEATRLIKEKCRHTKVLILTIHANEEYIYEMIRAGANGYVLKDAEKNEIFNAVRTVASAEPFFSANISKIIVDTFANRSVNPEREVSSMDRKLTNREEEILGLIAEGYSSREIAEKLYLSASTINTHRANMMQKLDIHDTASLVRFAIQEGLVKSEAPAKTKSVPSTPSQ